LSRRSHAATSPGWARRLARANRSGCCRLVSRSRRSSARRKHDPHPIPGFTLRRLLGGGRLARILRAGSFLAGLTTHRSRAERYLDPAAFAGAPASGRAEARDGWLAPSGRSGFSDHQGAARAAGCRLIFTTTGLTGFSIARAAMRPACRSGPASKAGSARSINKLMIEAEDQGHARCASRRLIPSVRLGVRGSRSIAEPASPYSVAGHYRRAWRRRALRSAAHLPHERCASPSSPPTRTGRANRLLVDPERRRADGVVYLGDGCPSFAAGCSPRGLARNPGRRVRRGELGRCSRFCRNAR